MEKLEEICSIREQFDNLTNKNAQENSFCDIVSMALEDNNVPSVEDIRKDYENKTKKDRLLRIGIVGAVKAGKSSLLNSLFFKGQDILPKAATPMTAALTELTYGEKYCITVDFFTEDDIKELKRKSREYERRLEETKKKKIEEMLKAWQSRAKRLYKQAKDYLEGRPVEDTDPDQKEMEKIEKNASRAAERELKENIMLSGAYDQYRKIKESGITLEKKREVFEVESVKEIASRLEDYVGAEGKYMPFTSKVSITLPFEELRGISVIDTPGFNDPVPSRDDRARQGLRECDVIFLLSRSGQFLSSNDMEVMGKITKTKNLKDVVIIASQADNPLVSPEYKGEKLDNVIDKLKTLYADVIEDNFRSNNQTGAFDSIIEDPEDSLFIVSGMCDSMASTFEERENWESGKKTIWRNLQDFYPDYFSDSDEDTSIASLRKLGNTAMIRKRIDKVKEEKERIFQEQIEKFERNYKNSMDAAKENILRDLKKRQGEIRHTKIEELQQEIEKMEKDYYTIAPGLDLVFQEVIENWKNDVKIFFESKQSDNWNKVKENIKRGEGEITKEWTTGILFWETKHSATITTINLHAVKNAIDDYIQGYNSFIPNYIEQKIFSLKKAISSNVLKHLMGRGIGIEGSVQDGIGIKISSMIDKSVSNLDKLYYSGGYFTYGGGGNARLEGQYADACINAANNFINNLHEMIRGKLREFVDNLYYTSRRINFSEEVLQQYLEKKKQLEADLKEPQLALENIAKLLKAVGDIKCQ